MWVQTMLGTWQDQDSRHDLEVWYKKMLRGRGMGGRVAR